MKNWKIIMWRNKKIPRTGKFKDKLFPRVDCPSGKSIYKYYLEKHRTQVV